MQDYSARNEELELLRDFEKATAREEIEPEGLNYIGGFVAHKFRYKYAFLGTPTKFLTKTDKWLFFISRENCIQPSENFLMAMKVMNESFKLFPGEVFHLGDKIFDKLTNIVTEKLAHFPNRGYCVCSANANVYTFTAPQ